MFPSISRLLACAVFAYGLPSLVAQEKKELTAPRHLPGGGVADPAGKVGFFPSKAGGIDALELASGKLLWSSKDADRPLVATADRLFAQAGTSNQVRVLVLDTTKQGKI